MFVSDLILLPSAPRGPRPDLANCLHRESCSFGSSILIKVNLGCLRSCRTTSPLVFGTLVSTNGQQYPRSQNLARFHTTGLNISRTHPNWLEIQRGSTIIVILLFCANTLLGVYRCEALWSCVVDSVLWCHKMNIPV